MALKKGTISPQYLRTDEIAVMIMEIKGPDHFIVREPPSIDTSSEASKFVECERDMQTYYQSIEPSFFSLPLRDSIVVVLHKQKFYRAQVCSILMASDGGHVIKVYLLDYGQQCSVTRQSLFLIEPPFLVCHFQAIDFKLLDVEPISLVITTPSVTCEYGPVDTWDPSAINYTQKLCEASIDVRMIVKGVDIDGQFLCGSLLLVLDSHEVLCLNDALTEKMFARQRTDYLEKAIPIEVVLEKLTQEIEKSDRSLVKQSTSPKACSPEAPAVAQENVLNEDDYCDSGSKSPNNFETADKERVIKPEEASIQVADEDTATKKFNSDARARLKNYYAILRRPSTSQSFIEQREPSVTPEDSHPVSSPMESIVTSPNKLFSSPSTVTLTRNLSQESPMIENSPTQSETSSIENSQKELNSPLEVGPLERKRWLEGLRKGALRKVDNKSVLSTGANSPLPTASDDIVKKHLCSTSSRNESPISSANECQENKYANTISESKQVEKESSPNTITPNGTTSTSQTSTRKLDPSKLLQHHKLKIAMGNKVGLQKNGLESMKTSINEENEKCPISAEKHDENGKSLSTRSISGNLSRNSSAISNPETNFDLDDLGNSSDTNSLLNFSEVDEVEDILTCALKPKKISGNYSGSDTERRSRYVN